MTYLLVPSLRLHLFQIRLCCCLPSLASLLVPFEFLLINFRHVGFGCRWYSYVFPSFRNGSICSDGHCTTCSKREGSNEYRRHRITRPFCFISTLQARISSISVLRHRQVHMNHQLPISTNCLTIFILLYIANQVQKQHCCVVRAAVDPEAAYRDQ